MALRASGMLIDSKTPVRLFITKTCSSSLQIIFMRELFFFFFAQNIVCGYMLEVVLTMF